MEERMEMRRLPGVYREALRDREREIRDALDALCIGNSDDPPPAKQAVKIKILLSELVALAARHYPDKRDD
jgi:hypothetical protein